MGFCCDEESSNISVPSRARANELPARLHRKKSGPKEQNKGCKTGEGHNKHLDLRTSAAAVALEDRIQIRHKS